MVNTGYRSSVLARRQVLPLSSECVSPVPTQTMRGSDGATATSPIVKVDSRSKIGVQVIPLFSVFHRLPEPTPT